MQALLDEVTARFGVSVADGIQLLSPAALLARPFDPGMAVLIVPGPDLAAPVLPGRGAHAGSPATMLRALYPGTHPVHALGAPEGDTTVDLVTDEQLAAADTPPSAAALSQV